MPDNEAGRKSMRAARINNSLYISKTAKLNNLVVLPNTVMKIPSQFLIGEMQKARKSFQDTATEILRVFQLSIQEGFSKSEAKKLICEQIGLSDSQVRRYLPAEAKDMKHDGSKNRKPKAETKDDEESVPKGQIVEYEKTIDQLQAEIVTLREKLRAVGNQSFVLSVPPKFESMVRNYISRGHKFKFEIKNGEISNVVPE